MSDFKCTNDTIAYTVCLDTGCKQHAFACEKRNCCPDQPHLDCKKMQFNTFLNTLELNFQRLSRISSSVSSFYQDLIKEITKDAIQFSQWTQNELQLKRKFITQTRNGHHISGSQVAHIMDSSNKYSQEFEEHILAYIIHWEKTLKNQLNSIREELYENHSKSDRDRNSGRNSNSLYNLSINTNMDWRDEEQDMLLELISEEKRIKEFKKLYTASQHDFDVAKFHEICDKKTDTLVLVKNSKGKIYGGFTPCAWESNQTGQYKVDPQHKSFVFSVSNGTKYILAEDKFAIQCHSLFGPIFGRGGLMMIQNHADKQQKYWETLPLTYVPASGEPWTKQHYIDFLGAEQGEKYNIVEWEVFKVYFQ